MRGKRRHKLKLLSRDLYNINKFLLFSGIKVKLQKYLEMLQKTKVLVALLSCLFLFCCTKTMNSRSLQEVIDREDQPPHTDSSCSNISNTSSFDMESSLYTANKLPYDFNTSATKMSSSSVSFKRPPWFYNPRYCVSESVSCSLTQNSGEPNITLGQHICNLDTCHPNAVDLFLGLHEKTLSLSDSLFSELRNTTFLFIGDSTGG